MSEKPTQKPTENAPTYTRTLGRAQREDKLKQLFAIGVSTIPDQIRYALALSQMTNTPSINVSHNVISQTVTKARLTALTKLTQAMDGKQVQNLLKEVHQIEDDAVRI